MTGFQCLQFNARSETVAEKSIFSRLLKGRRCLVPLQGFYEWRQVRCSWCHKLLSAFMIWLSEHS